VHRPVVSLLMEVRWSPEATEDLERIGWRIQHDKPTAARNVVFSIYRGIAGLRTFQTVAAAGELNTPENCFFLLCLTSWFTGLRMFRIKASKLCAFITQRMTGHSPRVSSALARGKGRVASLKEKKPSRSIALSTHQAQG
jgi:hypothetical protein